MGLPRSREEPGGVPGHDGDGNGQPAKNPATHQQMETEQSIEGTWVRLEDKTRSIDPLLELGKLGVQVERPQSVLEWLDFNPFTLFLGLREKERSFKAARPYLSRYIGGDGLQTVGEKVLHANDWDGLVHIEPFGCLPEIMARNIMPSTKEQLPVLNLMYDEHTGRAGVINRLEAFVDMIKRKKKNSLELRV